MVIGGDRKMAGSQSHSSSLFVTRDGAPMRFYVRPGPSKKQLAPLITHGGGVVCRIQEPGAFLLADRDEGILSPGYISSTFITDCVSSNRSLSPRAYRLLPLTTRVQTRRSISKLALGLEAHGRETEADGKLTNNAGTSVPSQKQNPLTTSDPATGGDEDSMDHTGDLSPEGVHGDEGTETHSNVDQTNKETSAITGNSLTSMVATKEEATPKKDDHAERKRIPSPMTPRNEKRRCSRRLAARGRSLEDSAPESEKDQETLVGTAASREETNEDETNKHDVKRTPSKTRQKSPSLKKEDVEETIDEDENFCTQVDPEPRTSTPACGNSDKMDLDTDGVHDGAPIKDEESQPGTPFRRLTRRVAGKRRLSDGGDQQIKVHKKPREDSPTGDALMSLLQSHSAQIKAETESGKDEGHRSKCLNAETGEQRTIKKELDSPSTESHQALKLRDALTTGRMAFTREEDVAILLYIRDNQCSRCTVTGNVLWMDMEKKKVLRRTWQSMKARFVKYLVFNKHRYKLPPKNSAPSSTDSISKEISGPCPTNASTSIVIPQESDANLPSASAHVPQNCDTTPPDIPQKCHVTPPSASDGIHAVCDTRLPRSCTITPQKNYSMLPSTSMVTPQKGNKMSLLPQSSKTDLPDKEYSDLMDSEELRIFERANKEFEETDNYTSPEQPVLSSSQKENKNELHVQNDASPKQPGPIGSQKGGNRSSEKSNALSGKNGDNSASHVGDATGPVQPDSLKDQGGDNSASHGGDATGPVQPDSLKGQGGGNSASHGGDTTVPVQPEPRKNEDGGNSASHGGDTTVPVQPEPRKAQDGGNSASHGGDSTGPVQPGQDGGNSASHVRDNTGPDQPHTMNTQNDDTHLVQLHPPNSQNGNSTSHVGDHTCLEQPGALISLSHVNETPFNSQESEGESLRKAMTDMMREFNLDVYCVTQALFFNNGELGSTRHFLRTGTRPDGYPIWDPKDDSNLKNNPKMQSHLIGKYGGDNVAKRVAFLES